ncbi:MAG TPA: PKD domain-containing protein [Planctomycetota bacterium]|nr:PKD domain-containing protein [Planctomycetota bacterium]
MHKGRRFIISSQLFTKWLFRQCLLTALLAAAVPAWSADTVTGKPGVAGQQAIVNFAELARTQQTTQPAHRNIPLALRSKAKNTPPPERQFVRPREAQPRAAVSSRSPLPTDSFPALGDDDTAIPPDCGGAVGPNHIMTVLNTQVRIQARDGAEVSTVSLNAFWASLNKPNVPDCFDPKVLYDPYEGRWIFTALANAFSASSAVLIGVSQTVDPTGNWNLFRIDADASDTSFADYPTIGFNKNWIAVSTNMFDNFFEDFSGVNIYVFDKRALYDNTGGKFTLVQDLNLDGFTICPVVTYDAELETLYLIEEYNGFEGLMRVSTITGPVGAEVLTLNVAFPSSPDQWTFFGPLAPQLGSTQLIDSGDGRVNNAVYRGGFLWCAHTVYPFTEGATAASIQWWQIAANGSVLQRGRVEDPTAATHYGYPSLAVNSSNDIVIGYSRFSAAQFASGNYVFRFGSDPLNTMRGDTVLKAGEAPYFKTKSGQLNRWGDYTSTVVDPVNDRDFWTLQQYAATPVNGVDRWGTWWGRIIPAETGTFVSLTALDARASEPGVNTASFQFRRTSPQGALAVNYSLGGTAVNGTDYELLTGVAVFNEGELTTRVIVKPLNNDALQGDRTIIVSIAPGDGYSAGSPSTTLITIEDDEGFSITSGPTATPNPAIKGLTVQFSAAIDTPDIAFVLWDFGDGTEDTNNRLNVAHAFPAEGEYTVTVIAFHARGPIAVASVDVIVSEDTDNDGNPDVVDTDDDNDGFPDDLEDAFGSDPLDAESTPTGGAQAQPPLPLTISRFSGRFSFKDFFVDSVQLSGEFPINAGTVKPGELLIASVGGIVSSFTLDSKGRGFDGFGSIRLLRRVQKNVIPKQNARFFLKLTDGDYQTDLADEGVAGDKTVVKKPLTIEVTFLYQNTIYQARRAVLYSARANISGTLKEAKQ